MINFKVSYIFHSISDKRKWTYYLVVIKEKLKFCLKVEMVVSLEWIKSRIKYKVKVESSLTT